MKEIIQKLCRRQNLTQREAMRAMQTIMEGRATEAQIAAFIVALKLKGEHPNELLGFLEVMKQKSLKVNIEDPDAIDMCGTGGDGTGTFNISTVASFVVAGAGITVAKHGNRSISSSCGSADVLQELGVKITLPPEKTAACINTIGIGFLFAPLYHTAMKHVAKPRAELGMKTCFNLLGPMTNPAGVQRQLVGAFSNDAAEMIASVFLTLHTVKVYVVHSEDGLDEVSLEEPTSIYEVTCKQPLQKYRIDHKKMGLPSIPRSSLIGGSPKENASIAVSILEGNDIPQRNIVLANAAFGLLASGKAKSIQEGIQMSAESIDSGKALKKLKYLQAFSNQ